MNSDLRTKHSLFLEHFDIMLLSKIHPDQKIGVNVSRIYLQIARYSQNPHRKKEMNILKKAIFHTSNKYHVDSKYAIMEVQDIIACFGYDLKKLPKTTFVSTHWI